MGCTAGQDRDLAARSWALTHTCPAERPVYRFIVGAEPIQRGHPGGASASLGTGACRNRRGLSYGCAKAAARSSSRSLLLAAGLDGGTQRYADSGSRAACRADDMQAKPTGFGLPRASRRRRQGPWRQSRRGARAVGGQSGSKSRSTSQMSLGLATPRLRRALLRKSREGVLRPSSPLPRRALTLRRLAPPRCCCLALPPAPRWPTSLTCSPRRRPPPTSWTTPAC